MTDTTRQGIDTAALTRAMGALRRAAQKGGCEEHDLAAWETVNAAINRLELEHLIERCAIQRVIEEWERVDPIDRNDIDSDLIEAIEGLRSGDEVMA